MTKTVVIAGALDTKGAEFAFVQRVVQSHGLKALVVDFGVLGEPLFAPDITNAEVAQAGGSGMEKLRGDKDKAEAMKAMTAGLAAIVRRLYDQGELHGIMSMGGTSGTGIATAAMRTLPVGIPKLMVSTVAAGDIGAYVGARDITMMPSVVDVAGINRISRTLYANAAGAIAGMVQTEKKAPGRERPLIAASMFGNTTPCVDRARTTLESQGYEVLVFHATGAGGKTMQDLIEDGYIAGVFDVTTTELADEICGGVFTAGPDRVRLGAKATIPIVLAPGCVDMCNFWALSTVPERYKPRNLYQWNPNVTLMRTNIEENAKIGQMLAATANSCLGPVAVLVPLKGVSMLDSAGGQFWDPEADRSCFDALKQNLRGDIPYIEVDANINDEEFSDRSTQLLITLIEQHK